MEIPIHKDGKDQSYVEWDQGRGGLRRAWIRRPENPDKDQAGVGRYLNVVRVESPHTGPAGNSTDFPISSDLDDEQILVSFVTAVTSITGRELKFC